MTGRPPELQYTELLRSLQDAGERDFRALGFGRNAYVRTRFGQVDLVQHFDGLPGWDVLHARSVRYDVGGMVVRAIDRQTLIDRKRARGSSQDLADIEQLEALDD